MTKFISVCPLGHPLFIQKVKRKMDPIFEHPVFDSAREKMKRFIRQHEKSQEAFEIRCTLVSNVGAARYFPSQNRSTLLMRRRLYSTSVVIVTINGEIDYATSLLQ